jgi:CRP/FNR family transcriptional regulator
MLSEAEFADFTKVPLFASLFRPPAHTENEALARRIRDQVSLKSYGSDAAIFEEKTAPDYVYVVKSGSVMIVLEDEDGDRVILAFFVRGEVFGEIAAIDGKPRSATARAVEHAILYVVPRQVFVAAFEQNAGVAQALARHLMRSLRRTTAQLRSKVLYESRRAVLDQLLRSSSIEVRAGDILLKPKYQVNEIAQILGIERETVSRALHDLQDAKKLQKTDKGQPIRIERAPNSQITSVLVPTITIKRFELYDVLEEVRSDAARYQSE